MGAKSLPAAVKKGAISSPANSERSRGTGWLLLRRSARIGRYAWVISIPKKVIPTSVRRSRLKRLVREAIRMLRVDPAPTEQWRFAVKSDPSPLIKMSDVALMIGKLVAEK